MKIMGVQMLVVSASRHYSEIVSVLAFQWKSVGRSPRTQSIVGKSSNVPTSAERAANPRSFVAFISAIVGVRQTQDAGC